MRLDYAAQPVKYESMAAPIIGGSILCEPDEIREALDACAQVTRYNVDSSYVPL